MTTTTDQTQSSQNFRRIDSTEHIQILNEQLDQTENNHHVFRQKLLDQKKDSKNQSLINEINKWEKDSIKIIKQIANDSRQKLIIYTNKYIDQIEKKLNDLTKQIKQIREQNQFNQLDLNQLKQKLTKLEEDLDRPLNIYIEQQSNSFINQISVITPSDNKWKQSGLTIAGGNSQGKQLNQLSFPEGIFIDHHQTIYIADYLNHRIVEWKSNANECRIVAGGNGQGNQTNQLNYPTNLIINKENESFIISDKGNRRVMRWSCRNNTDGQIIIENIDCYSLTMDKDGSLYVSDYKKNNVRRWKKGERDRTIVAGGNGKGDQLNQLNYPTFIFVDEDYSLYVSDSNNHRVIKWIKDAEEGIIVAGGNGQGNSLTQLSYPQGVIVDQLGQIYVADRGNDRVMCWCSEAKEGTIIIGENGKGKESNQLNGPVGLSFDFQGNLYVADWGNDRIQKFNINVGENSGESLSI